MSENKIETPTPEVKTEASSVSGKIGIMMSVMGFAAVIAVMGYGYLTLSKVNISLTNVVGELRQQVSSNKNEMMTLQQSLANVQKITSIAEQQGDLTKWHVVEAQYLTKLAEHHLQLTRDTATALILLQHADDIMREAPDVRVSPIRQALAENLASLQSQPQVNFEELYLKMAAIDNSIDSLPLPPTPLQYTEEVNARQKDYSEAPWWKTQWHKSMDAIRKVVIVRYMAKNDLPLVMPEEKMFLYQNLHAQMQAVMLSVLNRNATAYQASLTQVAAWVQKYFVHDAPETNALMGDIRNLQAVNLQPPEVNIAATLQLFNDYLLPKTQPENAVTP